MFETLDRLGSVFRRCALDDGEVLFSSNRLTSDR
jgi:hypothetical protein